MAKRKKRNDELEMENRRRSSVMRGDAKRSAAAIFLFALAVIFLLGFVGSAGALGRLLNKLVGILFGWGKWLSPWVLIIGGIILLYRKETKFYVSKLIGLFISFISILGFFHLYFGQSQYVKIAQQGAGGGYVGYTMAIIAVKLAGIIGGSVILVALLFIGIIVAFNFSLASFIEKIKEIRNQEKEPGVAGTQEGEEINIDQKQTETDETEVLTGSENIKSIEFVEGPENSKKNLDHDIEAEKESRYFLPKKSKKWIFPPIDLLEPSSGQGQGGDIQKNAEIIKKTLGHFGIEVELGDIKTGPTITQYSFRPAVGIKLSKITGLNSNIALALAAPSVRIEAPIPGKSLVGIEVPNKSVATVKLREFIQSDDFRKRQSNLTLALGKDVSGNYIFANLDKMPHLMVAGSTGSGKSVCINSILLSLLYQNSPEDLKLILVDPKRVELSLYNGIPHLKTNTVVENGKVINVLKWSIREMENRYQLLQETGSRDIVSYNQKAERGQLRKYINPETNEEQEEKMEKMPYIIIVIDELADLMVSHGKEVESAIIRIAQMARAVGIHLIVSTQRPSVEVITGLIKANITTRIAFRVATQIDSRTILDFSGAEKLLGNGDMLYISPNFPGPKRLQGVFMSEAEVKRVVNFLKEQKYDSKEELSEDITKRESFNQLDIDSFSEATSEDSLYQEIKEFVVRTKKASASLLQRHFRIGYPKAARILDMLEKDGVIGPANGSKPREVIIASQNPTYQDSAEDREKRDKWQI